MKSVLIPWCIVLSLLLQTAAWAMPAQRLGQAAQLAHQLAHGRDHGHHGHAENVAHAAPHDIDEALFLDNDGTEAAHGPHHVHAAEPAPLTGLPVAMGSYSPLPQRSAPGPECTLMPPSAELAAWLRPPKYQA